MKKLIATILALGLASCGGGGASNNDQGVAFTLLGFTTQDECAENADGPNLSGLSTPFSEAIEGAGRGGGVYVGFYMRNNLCKQFVRTDQVFMDYFIPGAAVQPPSTSAGLGAFMDATNDACDGEISGASSSEACGVTSVVPAEIRQWMLLNRNSLPELPFTMQVRATVSGITASGDRLDTNEAILNVQFVTDLVIEPGDSEGTDGETGGDIVEGEGDVVDEGTDEGTTPDLDVPSSEPEASL